MSKFIFVSFPNEATAYEGTRALEALHAEGSLTLYGLAVLAKSADGTLSVKRESDRGVLGLAVGAVLGGLLGLLGGPVGTAIGLGGGALLGSLSDLANLGVSREFIHSAAQDLTPGKAALVAEVSEEWVTPLNVRMGELGGTLHRTGRAVIEDDLSQKEIAAAQAELAHLKVEYNHAKTETKATLKARIDEMEAKVHAASSRLERHIADLKLETEAKLTALRSQAAQASGDLKAKVESRIAELQTDGERRVHQLKEAWGLTRKAFAS
jgi:uncharacterized membrane protein